MKYPEKKNTKQRQQTNRKTERLTQSNQWVGVDHAARIQLLSSPPVTGSVEKNKMPVMMTMMI